MLTGDSIKNKCMLGDIFISDFDDKKLNPNSYNLTLAPKLKIYKNKVLDMYDNNPTKEIVISDKGYVLKPGVLYIGSTNEYTKCKDLIPCIDGRSSIGRLGIQVHMTAGFGDVGFEGKWTLEITVVHKIRIYPNCEICQIYFEEPNGSTSMKYKGKYQFQTEPIASKLYMEK